MAQTWLIRGVVVLLAASAAALPLDTAAAAAAAACGDSQSAPLTDQPWPLRRLRPDRIWPVTRGQGIVVAVVDSGVSDDHPALRGKVRKGFDLIQNGDGKCDEAGHGTLIAGLIAGRDIQGSTFHGLAPDAEILPIRVLRKNERVQGDEHSKRIADGIRLAVDNDADIINLSLTTMPTPQLESAIRYAQDRDVILVAAAGNTDAVSTDPDTGEEISGFPAAYEDVIAVAAINIAGGHHEISVIRDYIDIAAPGDDIAGPAPRGGGFNQADGTSFATAYVSGTAALVRAYRKDLTAAKVRERIVGTADPNPAGWNKHLGHGVVNPYWAVFSLGAEDEEPAPPVRVGLSAPEPDPLRNVRILAIWTAVIAAVISLLLVSSVSVWRRGQRRRWRPGQPE
jgi:type VII secretion-associated serine protease mycosin